MHYITFYTANIFMMSMSDDNNKNNNNNEKMLSCCESRFNKKEINLFYNLLYFKIL